MKEVIICSAVRRGDKVWYGHRHTYCYRAMYDELSWELPRKEIEKIKHEDGFVTSTGRFVGRKEAQKIHKDTVGVSHDKGGYRGDGLFSEDLY